MKRANASTKQKTKRRAIENEADAPTLGEQLIAALLEHFPPISTTPLIVSRALLNKARSIGLPLRTAYSYVTQDNLDYCLTIGLCVRDIVPAALLSGNAAFYEWARLKYPSVMVLDRALRMGPLPPTLITKLDRQGLNSCAIERIIKTNRLELLDQHECWWLAEPIVKASKPNDTALWNRVLRAPWYERHLLVHQAARHGRLDILRWCQAQPVYHNFRMDNEVLVEALVNNQIETALWLMHESALLIDVDQVLIKDPCDRIELFEARCAMGHPPTPKLLRSALIHSKLILAAWICAKLQIDPSKIEPDFLCADPQVWDWLSARGLRIKDERYLQFNLQSAVACGRLTLAQELSAHWRQHLFQKRYWELPCAQHWPAALQSLLEREMDPIVQCELVKLVLEMQRGQVGRSCLAPQIGAREFCNTAARKDRFDLVVMLKEHGAKWNRSFWVAALKGQSLTCLKYAREQLCPCPKRLLQPECLRALLDCGSDEIWAFMMEQLDWDNHEMTQILLEGYDRKLPSRARLEWLLKRVPFQLKHDQNMLDLTYELVQRSPPEYELIERLNLPLAPKILKLALKQNDCALEHYYTRKVYGVAVSVDVDCAAQDISFTVDLGADRPPLQWRWPFQLEWSTSGCSNLLRLSSASGLQGLVLIKSRNALPFAEGGPAPQAEPLFLLSGSQMLCNQEANHSVVLFLILRHLELIARKTTNTSLLELGHQARRMSMRFGSRYLK